MMTFAIKTLGCKVNLYESNYIREKFIENDLKEVDFSTKADIYIINSCTVTNRADQKTKQMINRAKKQNSEAVLVVIGCYVYHNQLDLDKVDVVVGQNQKSLVFDLVQQFLIEKKKIIKICNLKEQVFEEMIVKKPKQTRAFVKIQDGCDNYCSYCIIPYVRGKQRSKKSKTVILEIANLIKNGYQEIVLTGIHTSSYGKDIDTSFSNLLESILEIQNLKKLRISSLEITDIDHKFLKLLTNPIIVNHLHIPLQSGSDNILVNMNRKYNIQFYEKMINKIRLIRPEIKITTDVIVGFPGEKEDDFLATINQIKKINFLDVHIFPFSIRPYTKASKMDDQLTQVEIKKRTKYLDQIVKEQHHQHLKKYLKKETSVLFEQKKGDYFLGHNDSYVKVKVKTNQNLLNKQLNVKIKSVLDDFCLGEIKKG